MYCSHNWARFDKTAPTRRICKRCGALGNRRLGGKVDICRCAGDHGQCGNAGMYSQGGSFSGFLCFEHAASS